MNTLRPSYTVDADGRFTEFAVEQEAAASHPVLRSHRIAIGLYDRTADGMVRRHRIETDVAGPRTVIGELAGQPRPDLVLVNDEDLTYAKIRLDEHSLRTLVDSIADFTDSLPAALCWSAAWDMCRDGEMAARDYVHLVLAGISSVADISVVQTLLRQASLAVRRFADPGWRETGLALMASTLRGLLHGAAPGSDAQLAYVRAFAGVATSAEDLALLAGLLDGSAVLDGLAVDTDLRWALLSRLVSRGSAASARSGSTRSWPGTPPTRASGTPRRAARPSPPPRPSRRPGTRWSRASRPWPRSAPPCPGSSTRTSRS